MVRSSVRTKISLAALGMAVIAACDNSPSGPSTSVTLTSVASLDGRVRSDGNVSTAGGGPITGDNDATNPGLGYRQFFSFDLSTVPGAATLESATLRLHQSLHATVPPYATHGNVIVDRVDIGLALDTADYGAPALTGNIGTLSINNMLEYKELDVTGAVRADRNGGRVRSDFRLRMANFDSNNDGISQYTLFADAELSCCASAQPPQLVIKYATE